MSRLNATWLFAIMLAPLACPSVSIASAKDSPESEFVRFMNVHRTLKDLHTSCEALGVFDSAESRAITEFLEEKAVNLDRLVTKAKYKNGRFEWGLIGWRRTAEGNYELSNGKTVQPEGKSAVVLFKEFYLSFNERRGAGLLRVLVPEAKARTFQEDLAALYGAAIDFWNHPIRSTMLTLHGGRSILVSYFPLVALSTNKDYVSCTPAGQFKIKNEIVQKSSLMNIKESVEACEKYEKNLCDLLKRTQVFFNENFTASGDDVLVKTGSTDGTGVQKCSSRQDAASMENTLRSRAMAAKTGPSPNPADLTPATQ